MPVGIELAQLMTAYLGTLKLQNRLLIAFLSCLVVYIL
jgi:hypothetical protein